MRLKQAIAVHGSAHYSSCEAVRGASEHTMEYRR